MFSATISADKIDPRFDFQYLIEAMSTDHRGVIYPNFEIETPYVVVKLIR